MSHFGAVIVRHSALALTPTLSAVADLDVRIMSQPVSSDESPVLFYSVSTPSFDDFESALEDDHTVGDWDVRGSFDDRRVYRIRLSDTVEVLTPAFNELGVRILDAAASDRGWRLRVHVPDREALVEARAFCEEAGIDLEIERLYSADDEPGDGSGLSVDLTDRQREVAHTATRMGYFDDDGAGAEAVADRLDITPSTLSSHLRTITAKLFRELFSE